jgi:hypothetical protein
MMKNRTKQKYIAFLTIIFCLTVKTAAYGQHVSVSTSLDSTLMFIGGQMNFMIEVVQPADFEVSIPFFPDTITKNIEVVRYSNPDTVRNGDMLSIARLYRITSFDSGLHYIPPIEVEYKLGEMVEKQESRSLGILVINPFEEVDPQKGFFDIKQPLTLPFTFLEIIGWMNWALLFMLVSSLLVIAIHWWVQKRNPIKEIIFKEKPKAPPHITALRELDRIKSEKIWQKGLIKQYYSQLTDTIRKYMEERFGFYAMEQTTPEILQALKNIELVSKNLQIEMTHILETADLAKFAKFEPLPDENNNCLAEAYNFVNQTKIEQIALTEENAEQSAENENINNQTTNS